MRSNLREIQFRAQRPRQNHEQPDCRKEIMIPRRLIVLALICTNVAFASSETNKRILIVGDSWAEGMNVFGAVQHVLDRYGFSHLEAVGARTAIGGTKAERWVQNWKGHLDILREELERYPNLDIVLLLLGGNDFLSFAMRENLANLTAEQRQEQWQKICNDLKTLLDFIKSIKPHVRILLCDYDFLDPELMNAVFKLEFHGVSASNMNEALVELAREKRKLMAEYPDCGYVQNFGLMQWTFGNSPHVLPGTVPFPGKAPEYVPFPGGDIRFTSGKEAMPDGVHPVPRGYIRIVENCYDQYLKYWLLDSEPKKQTTP